MEKTRQKTVSTYKLIDLTFDIIHQVTESGAKFSDIVEKNPDLLYMRTATNQTLPHELAYRSTGIDEIQLGLLDHPEILYEKNSAGRTVIHNLTLHGGEKVIARISKMVEAHDLKDNCGETVGEAVKNQLSLFDQIKDLKRT